MTDDEMRIAIAEACGYEIIGRHDQYVPPVGVAPGKQVVKHNVKPLPDYPNDLNAMHEAEKTCLLKFGQQDTYANRLDLLCHPRQACFATARQRAEAFLYTFKIGTN